MGMRPETGESIFWLIFLLAYVNAEICPVENPTESPTPEGTSALGPVKRLMLKQKTCPDFKDDADQSHCCPSRITFGSFYCCTIQQKHEIQAEIASERRRQFVKKYLAVIIISTIGLSVIGIVVASIICKRATCCPLHHSKRAYSRSSTSFQIPSTHSISRYQPVHTAPLSTNQARHSGTFTSINSTTPPQTNKTTAYDAPPPYESHDTYRAISEQAPTNTTAQLQHQYNRVLENELNTILSHNDPPQRNGEFVRVPPPAHLSYPDTLHNVD